MKKYFAQLRPFERRLAVAVLVALFLVLNYIFIWPHLSDWDLYRFRLDDAKRKLALYRTTIAGATKYKALVEEMEGQGGKVPPEDQAINFVRNIDSQSTRSGVGVLSMSRQTTLTNAFFVELTQNLNVVANDQELVDFLYKLGSDASMIRVRDLELRPDMPHQHLNARIQLVASYQKNLSGSKSRNATAKPK